VREEKGGHTHTHTHITDEVGKKIKEYRA